MLQDFDDDTATYGRHTDGFGSAGALPPSASARARAQVLQQQRERARSKKAQAARDGGMWACGACSALSLACALLLALSTPPD